MHPGAARLLNIFGWQKPCYLLQEGYVQTFAELMSDTLWENYGRKSGNAKCPELHGPLRVRADRSSRDIQLLAWAVGSRPGGDAVWTSELARVADTHVPASMRLSTETRDCSAGTMFESTSHR